MKHTFLLPALAAALLLQPGLSRAQDAAASRRAAAEQLLTAMHTEQMLNSTITRVYAMVDKMSDGLGKQAGLTPEQIASGKKVQEEARETVHTQLSWDTLKGDMIQSYAETFTEPELKQLTDFYQTPIGQKLVEKQPELTEKMSKLTQQRMMAVMPAVMQKIRDASRKPSAAPDTSAPPAASPAAQ